MGNHYDSCREADRIPDKPRRELSEEEQLEKDINRIKAELDFKKGVLKKFKEDYPKTLTRLEGELEKTKKLYKEKSTKYRSILNNKLKNI